MVKPYVDDHGIPRDGIDVFVSYSQQDSKRVETIVERLRRKGLNVFWDRNLPAGLAFDEHLQRLMDASKLVLVCWSQKSAVSEWVFGEAEYARNLNKLVACKIEECNVPASFETFLFEDLSDWRGKSDHENWARLQQLIQYRIHKEASSLNISELELGPRRFERKKAHLFKKMAVSVLLLSIGFILGLLTAILTWDARW